MAMTKKEQAEFDAMVKTVAITKALRWTAIVDKDVPVPIDNGIVNAWSFNAYDLSVRPSCSSAVHHSIGNHGKTTSQNPIRQYSSRLLAAQAMRNALELEYATRLAKVDEIIEEESKS